MNIGKVFLGLFLIVIALVMMGDSMGLVNFQYAFKFVWPSFLVLWGITMIIERRFNFVKFAALIIGILYLLQPILKSFNQSLVMNNGIVWAVIILVIGMSIIFKNGGGKTNYASNERIHDVAIFGGKNTIINDYFKYAETVAVFGGAQLNLLNAKIDGDARIDATAIFGGVEIVVPDNFKVITNGTPVFGGIDNKTRNNSYPENAPVLYIDGTAIFGGIEIKN